MFLRAQRRLLPTPNQWRLMPHRPSTLRPLLQIDIQSITDLQSRSRYLTEPPNLQRAQFSQSDLSTRECNRRNLILRGALPSLPDKWRVRLNQIPVQTRSPALNKPT